MPDRARSQQELGALPAGRSRSELVAEVARVLAPLAQQSCVIVACSGGPDSVALAHLVAEARADLAVHLVVVRHGLRDDTVDVANVRRHAQWLGAPVHVMDVTVTNTGHGVEAAARDARYAALRRQAQRQDAAAILVAHSADDQAETLLMRIARGTGLDGLAGMRPVQADVWRPLLRIRRTDLHRFIHFEGLPFAHDPMNDSEEFRRVIVRQRVLPVLDEVADDPVGALTRLADLAGIDAQALDAQAEAATRRIVDTVGNAIVVDAEELNGLPGALASRVVRSAFARLAGAMPGANDVYRVLELQAADAVSLPGQIDVARSRRWLTITKGGASPPTASRRLAVPGVVVWPAAGLTIQSITAASDPWWSRNRPAEGQVALDLPGLWVPPLAGEDLRAAPPGGKRERMMLALPSIDGELVVRHRQAGDRITTAAGTRSLQDVLVDAGMPRAIREVWPVVTLSDDRIVWVAGIAADDALLRAGRTHPAIQLRIGRAEQH